MNKNNPKNDNIILSSHEISREYGKKENKFIALHPTSLVFKEGETYAIVGKSGSGKSTLLHLLVGLDKPTSGDVNFKGKSIFNSNLDDWRGQNIGIVFQQFFLQLNDTVMNNVSLPLKIAGTSKKERERLALEALEQVGLTDKTNNKANNLSGGQKQRVAIARAIIHKPSILVADEPTGNLDSENGDKIMDLLFELNKQSSTTLIIVTHDLDIAKKCSKIIKIKDGKLE
jgi:putative ABC transport system ATP-binding protein